MGTGLIIIFGIVSIGALIGIIVGLVISFITYTKAKLNGEDLTSYVVYVDTQGNIDSTDPNGFMCELDYINNAIYLNFVEKYGAHVIVKKFSEYKHGMWSNPYPEVLNDVVENLVNLLEDFTNNKGTKGITG